MSGPTGLSRTYSQPQVQLRPQLEDVVQPPVHPAPQEVLPEPAVDAKPVPCLGKLVKTLDDVICRATERRLGDLRSGEVNARLASLKNAIGEKVFSSLKSDLDKDLCDLEEKYRKVSVLTLDDLRALYSKDNQNLSSEALKRNEDMRNNLEQIVGDCLDVAEKLRTLANRAIRLCTDQQYDELVSPLIDLTTSFVARGLEINRLVDLAKDAGGAGIPGNGADTLGRLMARQAMEMHGTDHALKLLDANLKPIRDTLESLRERLGNPGRKPLPGDVVDIAKLELNIETAKTNLSDALKEGKGLGDFRAEPTVLKAIAGHFEEVKKELDALRGKTLGALAERFLDEVAPDYSSPEKKPICDYLRKFTELLHPRHKETVERALFTTLPRIIADLRVSVKALMSAEKGSQEEAAALDAFGACVSAIRKLPDSCFQILSLAAHVHYDKHAVKLKTWTLGEGLTDNQIASLRKTAKKTGADRFPLGLLAKLSDEDVLGRVGRRLKMMQTYRDQSDQTKADDRLLEGVLTGKFSVGTYVGAKVWGMPADLVNLSIDDKNLVPPVKPLGSGVFNTTYLCTYRMPDGKTKQFVFKPEMAGRTSVGSMTLMDKGSYARHQHLAHLNAATMKVARLLGTPSIVPHVSVGMCQGSFGLFMDVAPGAPPGELADQSKMENVQLLHRIKEGLKDKALLGEMVKATSDLLWNDLVSGQGDRHAKNYFVDMKRDGSVAVTGIDNDATFPPWRLGAHTFVLDEAHREAFISKFYDLYGKKGWDDDELDHLKYLHVSPRRWKKTLVNDLERNFGIRYVRLTPDGIEPPVSEIVIDPALIEMDDAEATERRKFAVSEALGETFGLQSLAKPMFISESMFENLRKLKDMSMAKLGEAFAPHLEDPARQLPALYWRIRKAWSYAEYLDQRHRVIKEGEWGSDENIRRVSSDYTHISKVPSLYQDFLNRHIFKLVKPPALA